MMLVHGQRSTINGRYHRKRFTAGGLTVREVIRTPELHLTPLQKPRPNVDNYQLQVEEGDGIRGNLIYSYRQIPADSQEQVHVDGNAMLHYLPILRKLTVLDELSSV